MDFEAEVSAGQRFEFGKNWQRYIATLDQAKLESAKTSLVKMLGDLRGKTFFDAGSGSGIFSLAAVQLGAIVHSIDYDPYSVECTRMLKERFSPQAIGSLNKDRYWIDLFGASRPLRCDLLLGVLHHTGDMWTALDNVAASVMSRASSGFQFTTTRGRRAASGSLVKRTYNKVRIAKALVLFVGFTFSVTRRLVGRYFQDAQSPLAL